MIRATLAPNQSKTPKLPPPDALQYLADKDRLRALSGVARVLTRALTNFCS